MKKIDLGEEFTFNGLVWVFAEDNGSIGLKKLRKAGKQKGEFIPPTPSEVNDFFKLKGYTAEAAHKFFEYYSLGDWKDGKGNQVKNWQRKAVSVWFRAEHQIKEINKQDEPESKFLF